MKFASQRRIQAIEDLAPRFFREVLDFDYDECLVTDESDLRDFTDAFGDHDTELETLLDRLQAHYLIDGRAAGSTRIVELLEFLQSRGIGE